ncbi:MAG: hypothetical protein JRI25_04880 [Deltaproteobacteria bacterium]|nr:hypothetical protein [Deltaproteobacteria bacterium]
MARVTGSVEGAPTKLQGGVYPNRACEAQPGLPLQVGHLGTCQRGEAAEVGQQGGTDLERRSVRGAGADDQGQQLGIAEAGGTLVAVVFARSQQAPSAAGHPYRRHGGRCGGHPQQEACQRIETFLPWG